MKRILWHLFGVVTTLAFAIGGGWVLERLKRPGTMLEDNTVWVCAFISVIGFVRVVRYTRWYNS